VKLCFFKTVYALTLSTDGGARHGRQANFSDSDRFRRRHRPNYAKRLVFPTPATRWASELAPEVLVADVPRDFGRLVIANGRATEDPGCACHVAGGRKVNAFGWMAFGLSAFGTMRRVARRRR
jgi:hypothetical protein